MDSSLPSLTSAPGGTSGFLVAHPSPGASTCLVIGGVNASGAAVPPLASYREVLWLTSSAAPPPPPAAAPSARLHLLPLMLPPRELVTALEHFIRRDLRRLPAVLVSASFLAEDREENASVMGDIFAVLQKSHGVRQTRQQDGFRWQQHLLCNLPAYAQNRVPASWQDALRGLPAFVCGAGPSLDVSAPVLAAHANEAVIFASDSSLRGLHRHGVSADFTVSIDVAKQPEKCLPPDGRPARAVLAAVSPPAWTHAMKPGSFFFLSSGQVTLDWLARQGVATTGLIARENCGNTALELACYLGCAPIYLFGLDLALDANHPTPRHNAGTDASLYVASGFAAAQKHPHVPGNYTASVPTWAPADWRSLDERLAGWPAGLVTNVNDRGARFRNTTLLHPAAFVLEGVNPGKRGALARLPAATSPESRAPSALSRLRQIAREAKARLKPLRAALRDQGPAGAAQIFGNFFRGGDQGAAFGAFSFKLMPHLLPPLEGSPADWSVFIDEFEELARTATDMPELSQPIAAAVPTPA